MYQEGSTLELKAELYDQKNKFSTSFLKTVSAFANFQTGKILFGVEDDGTIKGLDSIVEARLAIEHAINDSIQPRPEYKLSELKLEGKSILQLEVCKGPDLPYLYQGRAYCRRDTSSVPLDSAGLKHLINDSPKIDYDRTLSTERNLEFSVLEEALQQELGIENLTNDILRALGLMSNESFTMAGELLADTNHNPRSATQIVRFGKTISILLERQELTHISILSQYENAMAFFRKWYAPYEEIVGAKRVQKIQIPEKAFREALANALVHRRYDMNAAVQISMFEDRVEILSPGGLPENLNQQDFLYGRTSLLRNMTLAEVFHRLNLIEKFGTGILRIKQEYEGYEDKAQFQIEEHAITIILPVIGSNYGEEANNLPDTILDLIGSQGTISRSELEEATGQSKSKVYQALNQLKEEGQISTTGKGRSTRYQLGRK